MYKCTNAIHCDDDPFTKINYKKACCKGHCC